MLTKRSKHYKPSRPELPYAQAHTAHRQERMLFEKTLVNVRRVSSSHRAQPIGLKNQGCVLYILPVSLGGEVLCTVEFSSSKHCHKHPRRHKAHPGDTASHQFILPPSWALGSHIWVGLDIRKNTAIQRSSESCLLHTSTETLSENHSGFDIHVLLPLPLLLKKDVLLSASVSTCSSVRWNPPAHS